MPIIRSMMDDLKKRYGNKAGKNAYYALETNAKKKGILRSMLAKAERHHDLISKA